MKCFFKTKRLLAIMMLLIFGFSFGNLVTVKAADEYDTLREKWKMKLIDGESANLSDSYVARAVKQITTEAQSVRQTMDKTGTKTYIWSDLNSGSVSAQLTTAYERIKSMALAYNTYGSSLYQDSSLLSDIIYALDWYNANKYYSGKTSYQNWWDWQIGVPLALNDITILMYDHLTPDQITAYMSAIEFYQPTVEMTGANRAWECEIIGVRGVIVKDSTKITAAVDGLSRLFDYVTSGDGFYTDGSFVQHNFYAYTGGYGKDLLKSMTNMLYLVNGSSWQISDSDADNVFQWIYDSYEPVIYKGNLMDMVRGREISRYYCQDNLASIPVISSIIKLAEIAQPADKANFKSMVKYWLTSDDKHTFLNNASIPMIQNATLILNDTTVSAWGEKKAFHSFVGMNRSLQVTANYRFGISMNSSRIANYESINGENAKGWHTSDGMTYLYNADLSQYNDDFWPTVNAYRLPGTTVLSNTASTANTKNDRSFVGGATAGESGIVGMELKDASYTLNAKKSWFLFDDEIVALGSGINSSDGINVESIIENRKLTLAGDNTVLVNGTPAVATKGQEATLNQVSYVNLSGNVTGADIGYYFPDSPQIHALRETRSAAWSEIDTRSITPKTKMTNNFLTMWFDHGSNPTSGTYSYVILPNKNSAQTASYASNPDITILENSVEAQGVKEKRLNMTGVNFWNNATKTVGNITSNSKSSVITKEENGTLEILVSDPTQEGRDTIDLEINHSATSVLESDSNIVVTQLAPTIKVSVSVVGEGGRTFHVKLANTGQVSTPPVQSITLPYVMEAETLPVVSTSDSHKVSTSSIASGGQYDLFNANAVGDYIDYKISVPKSGTYQVKVRTLKSTASGTYQLKMGYDDFGTILDGYYTAGNYQEVIVGNITFNGPGNRILRFTCTGKNASSSAYKLSLDSISLNQVP
ncbi:polysaccharide lyase family 8 super-sandwich domain-containing protein [Lacrimispora sp.]|uniref:polysaccharide lyase family 8 super-sandwich domain-containing protein n=1 Tax=Lacrimispora sp. TaxID=2719234 RepID=UPI0028AFF305|nr:polysaccharide lyase family 8 super-sandwich domain-containing protein [Lacrimispora sp.]